MAAARTPMKAVEAFIDEALSVAYDPRRAKRAAVVSTADARAAEGYRGVLREGMAAQHHILSTVIRAGKKQGAFPSAHPDHDARAIRAIVNDLIDSRQNRDPCPSKDDAVRHLRRLAASMFGIEPTRRSPRRP